MGAIVICGAEVQGFFRALGREQRYLSSIDSVPVLEKDCEVEVSQGRRHAKLR